MARAQDSLRILEAEWSKLADYYFLKLQNVRIEAIYLRCLALIGTAHGEPKKKSGLLAQAERWAAEIKTSPCAGPRHWPR